MLAYSALRVWDEVCAAFQLLKISNSFCLSFSSPNSLAFLPSTKETKYITDPRSVTLVVPHTQLRCKNMNIVTSYFIVRRLLGTIGLGGDVRQHQHARQAEYLDCLRYNRQHPDVASIHLLVEGREAYQHLLQHVLCEPTTKAVSVAPGLRRRSALAPIVPVVRLGGGQPTYADFFAYATQLTAQRLTMVCNADVYLSPAHFHVEEVEALFREAAPDVKVALALTRYESDNVLDAPFLYNYRGSHDAFVFVPPVPAALVARVRHAQNGYKAENVVVHEFQRQGYLTLNPAFDLRLVHRHAADVRQWFPPVDESRYGRAYPCRLAEALKQIKEHHN